MPEHGSRRAARSGPRLAAAAIVVGIEAMRRPVDRSYGVRSTDFGDQGTFSNAPPGSGYSPIGSDAAGPAPTAFFPSGTVRSND